VNLPTKNSARGDATNDLLVKVCRQAGRYGGGDRRGRIWQNTYYKFLSGIW